ncbi:uncharacterized protein LOC120067613 [Benincasa hispida]|uniref:uncharacterized protein LOC120067613 n=1 Tax=Benincasa hispida TaxID=102211 RepID=UPI001901DCAC|nr:uncharacterized protein LOC120067613 [Benincasa hispida]
MFEQKIGAEPSAQEHYNNVHRVLQRHQLVDEQCCNAGMQLHDAVHPKAMSNSILQLLASDKFNGEGYSNWKSNINTILVVVDLRFVLMKECHLIPNTTANRNVRDIYDQWVMANEKSRAYILASIFDVLNKKYEVMPTTCEIMVSLQEMFGQPSSSVRHEAIKYVYSTHIKVGTNVREHVLNMMVHFNIVAAHRAMIDEISQISMIL